MKTHTEFKHIGIYALSSTTANKMYIGKTTDFEARIGTHVRALKIGKHKNHALQAHYNKHGEDFMYIMIRQMPDATSDDLKQAEAAEIKSHPRNLLFNDYHNREPQVKLWRPRKRTTGRFVMNLETNEVFESIQQAAESINITRTYLSSMMSGRFPNKTKMVYVDKNPQI